MVLCRAATVPSVSWLRNEPSVAVKSAIRKRPLLARRHAPSSDGAPQPAAADSPGRYPNSFKRVIDLLVCVPALLLSLPLWAIIALAIRLNSPGGVLFRQERVGRNGRLFVLWKFRTMQAGTPMLPTDQMSAQLGQSRVTRVGRLLRRTSLDELPQLVNVIRGEMSLVGPRPALPMQTDLNARRQAAGVQRLLPGITGWAQINGRDDLDDAAKVACDQWYSEHRSLRLDLLILICTLMPVATGRGNR